MPIYFFWGEDDFAINQAIATLKQKAIDPNWVQFNYDKLSGTQPENLIEALTQAMTPVFGRGERLIWLADTNLGQSCPEDLLSELERTLPQIPSSSHLLFTSSQKPDFRLKSTKLLEKYGTIQDFSLIPPWQTEAILKKVRETAQNQGVKLTPAATELLATSVGNDSRVLVNELEKLSLYQQDTNTPLDVDVVAALVNVSNQNSLQLATAILQGDVAQSLRLVHDLINLNEPALRIVATLVGQFRTWAIVKLMLEAGNKNDKEIASAADITNPKRIYFLRKEIQAISGRQLLATLPVLLELELSLKRGAEPLATLETKIIELMQKISSTAGA
jgi:DNA polymerase-3 subunit delta